jgi:hypothetical protein
VKKLMWNDSSMFGGCLWCGKRLTGYLDLGQNPCHGGVPVEAVEKLGVKLKDIHTSPQLSPLTSFFYFLQS